MALFAIIAPAERADLTTAVQRAFEANAYQFAPGQFVVKNDALTPQGIAKAVGANGEVGQIIVFTVADYWGYHNRELWGWLTAHGGAT
jgi:hypothetical protein